MILAAAYGLRVSDIATMIACSYKLNQPYTPANDIIMDEMINMFIHVGMHVNSPNETSGKYPNI